MFGDHVLISEIQKTGSKVQNFIEGERVKANEIGI